MHAASRRKNNRQTEKELEQRKHRQVFFCRQKKLTLSFLLERKFRELKQESGSGFLRNASADPRRSG